MTDRIDKNCLSYWYPKIEGLVPTPATRIIRYEANDLWSLCDGETPIGLDRLAEEIYEAAKDLSLPFFLRTGHTSGKHNWEDTCCVTLGLRSYLDAIKHHIAHLVMLCEEADPIGLPTNVWVVREMLTRRKVVAYAANWGQMPISLELRCFVDGNRLLCLHPYWPKRALRQGTQTIQSEDWLEDPQPTKAQDAELDRLDQELHCLHVGEINTAIQYAMKCGEALGGQWSVDLLRVGSGWVVTDMAEAARSYHYPACPQATFIAQSATTQQPPDSQTTPNGV